MSDTSADVPSAAPRGLSGPGRCSSGPTQPERSHRARH